MAVRHGVEDTDKHFVIDPVTRNIRNESGKLILIQYDHNSERFTFECPRNVDEHDMSLCNRVEIHYINTGTGNARSTGVYEVRDLQVAQDTNNVVTCSWLISRNSTQHVGKLNFVIRFACIAEDGTIEYAWNTNIYSDIVIAKGIYNGDQFVEDYVDVLEVWKQDLYSVGLKISSVEQTVTSNEDDGVNVVTMTMTDDSKNTFQIKNGSKGSPGVSVTHEWEGTTLKVTSASGTSTADLKGAKGERGTDVTHEWDGTILKITSASGTSSANLKGAKGDPGVDVTHEWDGTTLKVTSASGTSSANLKGDKGDKGDAGTHIVKIERTAGNGAPGTIDTYTVTTNDDTAFTFDVYNGADGLGVGDMLKNVYDPQNKNTDVFAYVDNKIGLIDDALNDINENTYEIVDETVRAQISSKQDRLDVPSWVASTLPSNTAWHTIAYGNGVYVAIVNESNKTAYSTNGIDWTETTNLPSESDWRSIVYGDGKFVAIAYGTAGAYSTDGITWTPIAFPVSRNRSSVAYGNGMFVAICASSNAVSFSTDGINWSESTLPSSGSWQSVTYGNGVFVAVMNDSDAAAYSSDGINWTAATLPSSARWRSVAYGNGMFVAVATNVVTAAYSSDGINWAETTIPTKASWYSVIYGNGMFMAVAYNSAVSMYSIDGINWIEVELPYKTYWYSVAYGPVGFVAIGFSSDKAAYAKTTELFAARINSDAIPVTSVNGKTGAVQLNAEDIGAAPNAKEFNLSTMGMTAVPLDGSAVTLTTDTTTIRNALANGSIKLTFQFIYSGATMTANAIAYPFYLAASDEYQVVFNTAVQGVPMSACFSVSTTSIVARCIILESDGHTHSASDIGLTTEDFTFTLEDGSTVTKAVYVG